MRAIVVSAGLAAAVFAAWGSWPSGGAAARAAAARPTESTPRRSAAPRFDVAGSPQVTFEANRGQTDPSVDFVARCRGVIAFLSPGGAVLAWSELPSDAATGAAPDAAPGAAPRRAVLRISFEGGAGTPTTDAARALPGKANYFVGDDPSRWVTDVPTWSGVAYRGLLRGVDLRWRGDGGALAFDLDVAPHADPADVRLRFEGALGAPEPTPDGGLLLRVGVSRVRLSAPVAWERPASGSRRPVDARFAVAGDGAVGFDVRGRDPALPLVIDPSITVSTYLGGSGTESAWRVATDGAGDVYVCGGTRSSDFPVTSGAAQASKGDSDSSYLDAVVAKFSGTSGALLWATYLGSTSTEYASDVAVDASGVAHVVGYCDSHVSFPLVNPYQTTGTSTFLAKVSASGSSLVYSTFLPMNAVAAAVDVDASGDVYVLSGTTVMYADKYDAAGNQRVYSTTIGGGYEQWVPRDLAVDASGNAWIAGYISSAPPVDPTTTGAFQRTEAGGYDGLLVRLSASGARAYTSYFGGAGDDRIESIALDAAGAPAICGWTRSSSGFPLANAAQSSWAGGYDGFVARFNPAATSLVYSTYLGGSSDDILYGIESSAVGDVVVGGQTQSSDFPLQTAVISLYQGATDGAVAALRDDGTLVHSSYLGGTGQDVVKGVALRGAGRPVYLGYTASTDFPTASPAQGTYGGGTSDFFVAQVPGNVPAFDRSPVTLGDATAGWPLSTQLTTTGGQAPYAWSVFLGSPGPGLSLSGTGLLSGTPTTAGTYEARVKLSDASGAADLRTYTLTVNPYPTVTTSSLPTATASGWLEVQMTSKDGTPPLAWSADSALPGAMTLSSAGLLSGVTPQAGDLSLTFRVTDANGAYATRALDLHVNEPPEVQDHSFPEWTQGEPYTGHQLVVTKGTGPFTWSLAEGSLPTVSATGEDPDGLASGDLDGYAAGAGSHAFTICATDANGVRAERTWSVTVNPRPEITGPADFPLAALDRPFEGSFAGQGGTGATQWKVATGIFPAGLSIDAQGGISGTPSRADRYDFRVTLTDGVGASAGRDYRIEVVDPADLSAGKATQTLVFNLSNSTRPTRSYLELLAGTSLNLRLQFLGKDDLPLHVALLDAAGTEIDLTPYVRKQRGKAAGRKFEVRNVPVAATGRYFLVLTSDHPFEGQVKEQLTVTPAKRLTGTASLDAAGGTVPETFSALAGTKLRLTMKPAKKSRALPHLATLVDGAGADVLDPAALREKKKTSTYAPKTPLGAGDHVFTVGNRGAEAGDVVWTVTLKSPRGYAFSLPDLAQTSDE